MYVCIYIYNAFGSNVYMSPQYVHSKYYISLWHESYKSQTWRPSQSSWTW